MSAGSAGRTAWRALCQFATIFCWQLLAYAVKILFIGCTIISWLLDLLQDKTVLSYIAYVLEVPDLDVVTLALDILEIFVKNVDNYIHITSTFGVRESLEAIINKYSLNEPKTASRAQHIKDDIERMKPPIYNLRSRCRRVIEPKKLKTHVIVLHVQGLLPVSNCLCRFIIICEKIIIKNSHTLESIINNRNN